MLKVSSSAADHDSPHLTIFGYFWHFKTFNLYSWKINEAKEIMPSNIFLSGKIRIFVLYSSPYSNWYHS